MGASRSPWDGAGSWPGLRAREGPHQLLLRDGEVDRAGGEGLEMRKQQQSVISGDGGMVTMGGTELGKNLNSTQERVPTQSSISGGLGDGPWPSLMSWGLGFTGCSG